jgi:hypothetical protein
MSRGLDPELMAASERLDEVAEILAAGIIRVWARLRASQDTTAEQVSVDFSPDRSGHAPPPGRRRRTA